jgi:hypothetical protein
MLLEIVSISSFIGSFLRENGTILAEKVPMLLVIGSICTCSGSCSTCTGSLSNENRSRQTCIERSEEENGTFLLVSRSIQEEIDPVCEIHVAVGERAGPFLSGTASFVAARAFG